MGLTSEEIKRQNPLVPYIESLGGKLVKVGSNLVTNICPLVKHKPGHLCVSVDPEKQLYRCHDCEQGGDIITWMSAEKGISTGDVLKKLGGNGSPAPKQRAPSAGIGKIECTYDYRNERGELEFQVVRMIPKDFRQRHMVGDKWVWSMEGVTRVLYHLPEVLKSQTVWIVEGEKDADNLTKLGYTATTNVGGAEKWLDAYTESLAGKDIIVCGDNDKKGLNHVELVFESIAGVVASSRIVSIPLAKDVSEFIEMFDTPEEAKTSLDELAKDATKFYKGVRVLVYSLAELEGKYRTHISNLGKTSLSLGRWLPSLGRQVRSLVPGDMVLVLGDTGIGKTAILSNIALASRPTPTIFFEMELPPETMFERFIALRSQVPAKDVEASYVSGEVAGDKVLDERFPGLFICTECGLSAEALENHIVKAQLKIGETPTVVLLDYVQLMQGFGKRYEKASDNAESLKIIAKRCGVIMIVASQVARPGEDAKREINLHSGKDSGSLENSSGLVIGAWKDKDDQRLMFIKVLKNTKGMAWEKPIECNYDGPSGRITERAEAPDDRDTRQSRFAD